MSATGPCRGAGKKRAVSRNVARTSFGGRSQKRMSMSSKALGVGFQAGWRRWLWASRLESVPVSTTFAAGGVLTSPSIQILRGALFVPGTGANTGGHVRISLHALVQVLVVLSMSSLCELA